MRNLMQIVGGQKVLADGDHESLFQFYGGLFGRFQSEVGHTGDLTRHIVYRCRLDAGRMLHFVGIEVEKVGAIPEGMVAWTLGDRTWSVWDDRDAVLAEEDIDWLWLDTPSSGRCTGEFSARLPVALNIEGLSERQEFWISANAYVDMREGKGNPDDVHLVDYDPSWPKQFEEMAGWLEEALGGDIALRIEHYGSTSIPGIPAKPVIDILVEIPSFSEVKQRVIPLLNNEMWEYWWYAGHMTLIKREKLMGQRTHHVHMIPKGHERWEGLAFRDYLRSHSDVANQYATLKRELAMTYREDRERYTQAKTDFVREVTDRAVQSG